MSSINKVIYAYKEHKWIFKTVKDAEGRTVRRLPTVEGCIFGTGATHWILDRVVWERFSQSRLHSDGRHLLQIQVQRVPRVFFY